MNKYSISVLKSREFYNELINSASLRHEMMEYFLVNENSRVTQHLATALANVFCKRPKLITPFIDELVSKLEEEPSEFLIRNILRLLQYAESFEAHVEGRLYAICFEFLVQPKTPVAIKVFSMTIMFRVVQHIPELGRELKEVIEEQLPYATAGYISRATKILKRL